MARGPAPRFEIARPRPGLHVPLPLWPDPCRQSGVPVWGPLTSHCRCRVRAPSLLCLGTQKPPPPVGTPSWCAEPQDQAATRVACASQTSSLARPIPAPPRARTRTALLPSGTPLFGNVLMHLEVARGGYLGQYAVFSGPDGREPSNASVHSAIMATPGCA
ncbi:hypothetical protein NDU88_004812 [Pleurodeles waltl]|uniref:Uncharacterized protein n=1 Tax=Pleurodeles waltl TaxID=8319 RepID=A0AAV7W618_PLEWA|nr:hypothetical protein NDU88_004812 [Pleurodeles waltl]